LPWFLCAFLPSSSFSDNFQCFSSLSCFRI
jgi:hypothetical protein